MATGEPKSVSRTPSARKTGSSLFREEAVRRYVRAREFGDVLRLPPRWTRWAYPVLVAAMLAGLLLLLFVEVPQYARGPAVVALDPERADLSVVALLPASWLAELRPGLPLTLQVAGSPPTSLTVPIVHVEGQALSAAQARLALGSAVPDAVELPASVVLARASLPAAVVAALDGEPPHDSMVVAAEARIGSERLIFALFPSLRASLQR